MTVNTHLMDMVLKQIKAEPLRWNQSWWRTIKQSIKLSDENSHSAFVYSSGILDSQETQVEQAKTATDCNTAFCFAGWACELSDEETKWHTNALLKANENDTDQYPSVISKGSITSAESRAKRLLGLSQVQASQLFATGNDLEDLEALVNAYKEKELKEEER